MLAITATTPLTTAMTARAYGNGNPGIVPPWLTKPQIWDPDRKPITNDPDVPHILRNTPTVYDPAPPIVPEDPDVPRIM